MNPSDDFTGLMKKALDMSKTGPVDISISNSSLISKFRFKLHGTP